MHERRKLFSSTERKALTPKYKQISNGDYLRVRPLIFLVHLDTATWDV
jgi:hypothetical protein